MKKALLVLGLISLLALPAFANETGDLFKKLPNLKQGIAYDIQNNDVNYLSTLEIAKWKGLSLEAGYSSTDAAVVAVSYQLLKLKDLGVTLPILDLIEFNIGVFGGYKRIGFKDTEGNNEFTWGPSLTLISLKF